MLEAIISFLPSEGAGSIGSLEYSKSERQKLAKEVYTQQRTTHTMKYFRNSSRFSLIFLCISKQKQRAIIVRQKLRLNLKCAIHYFKK